MSRTSAALCMALGATLLTACGSDSTTAPVSETFTRGTLLANPPARVASADVAYLTGQLSASTTGQQLIALAGTPVCGVDVYYLQYWTIGDQNDVIMDSGALMVPTGSAAQCSGSRPLVMYAHGTQFQQNANMADIGNPNDPAYEESLIIATIYAAQGYIVVAPNYAGYDTSTLTHHPYLNQQQNAADMIDALTAARSALPNTFTPQTTASGALFVAGYSEGGYVAMATAKALQAAGTPVTAMAGGSGPYALEATFDAVFYGSPPIGGTYFSPLVTTSYQAAYGNIYTQTTDIYAPQYADGINTLLPSLTPVATLVSDGKLPPNALFDSTTPVTPYPSLTAALAVPANPVFAAGFGNPYLIINDYRLNYVLDAVANPDGAVPTPTAGVPLAANPQNTLRIALKANDLRSWVPGSPILMCGSTLDPTVFFSTNAEVMAAYWAAQGVPSELYTLLDLNATPNPASPFAPLQVGFQTSEAAILASSEEQWVSTYHENELPFCMVAARGFFAAL